MAKYAIVQKKTQTTEYVVTVKKKKKKKVYKIFASNDSIWTEDYRNSLLWKITDDGNGFDVEFVNSEPGTKLDYSDFIELHLLFSVIYDTDKQLGPDYETYKIKK